MSGAGGDRAGRAHHLSGYPIQAGAAGRFKRDGPRAEAGGAAVPPRTGAGGENLRLCGLCPQWKNRAYRPAGGDFYGGLHQKAV